MTSKVTYLGDLRTEAEHLASNTIIYTDAPVDNNGKGAMFSPTDLVATALANCAITIMGIAANTHGINIVGSTCDILKTMGTNPRRIVKIDAVFTMRGQSFSEKERQLLINAAKTCPVFYSLLEDMEKNMEFRWED